MTGKKNRIVTVLMTSLLMMSMVSVAVTGTVAAQSYEEGDYLNADGANQFYKDDPDGLYLDTRDECVGDGLFDFGTAVNVLTMPCNVVVDGTIEDQTTANYAAENIKTDADDAIQEAQSEANESLDDALREAQTAYAKSLSNETATKADALAAADKAATAEIVRQMNNNLVQSNEKLVSRTASLSESPGVSTDLSNSPFNRTIQANRTLFPDSEASLNITFTLLEMNDGSTISQFTHYDDADSVYDVNGGNDHTGPLDVEFDSSDYSDKSISFRQSQFSDTWQEYKNARAQAVNEIEGFTDSISQDQFENLSASDIVDRRQAAGRWAEKYNETGSLGYAAALLSEQGYSVPENLTTSYDVRTDDGNLTGTIFTEPGSYSNLSANETYNGTNTGAYIITEGGEQKSLDGSFTIDEIRDKDGNELNRTSFREPADNYFSNVSEYRENLQQYQRLMNQTESMPDGDDDGGLGVDFGDGDGTVVMVLMILGGLAVLLVGGGVLVASMRSGGSSGSYNRRGGY